MFDDENLKTPDDVPVLPLPETALLPGEPMPLHIFEERYKLMAESAISAEKLIAIAHIRPGFGKDGNKSELYDVAALGRIVVDEKLSDGRFNLVVLGLRRIRICRFVQEIPYRRAKIEILNDIFSKISASSLDSMGLQLMRLAEETIKLKGEDPLGNLTMPGMDHPPLDTASLGALCDILAAALTLPATEKQMILEETDILSRAEKLTFMLQFQIKSCRGNPFPNRSHTIH